MAPSAPPPTNDPAPAWTARAAAAVVALTIAAAALRLVGIGVWPYAASEADGWLLLAQPIGAAVEAAAWPQRASPLGWLALHGLVDAGVLPLRGEGWVRLPAVFAGTLTVPLLAAVVRPHLGAGAALSAAAIVAVHPYAVAASQALDPAMAAALLALAGAAALHAGRRVVGSALAVLAAATSFGACGMLLAVALLALPASRHRQVAAGLGALAFAVGLVGLGAAMLPLVALAAVGWPVAPRRVRLVVGAVALGAVAVHGLPGGEFAAAVAVPALAALAARGLVELARVVRGGLAVPAPLATLAAAAPAVVVFTWLAVDTFLYASVHRGARSPWRAAAEALWDVAGDRGFTVAAGAGEASLRVYLRPFAGSGVEVRSFAPADGAAAVQAVAAAPAAVALLALREDELARTTVAARAALAAAFQCVRVVPSPQLHGDDTVTIFRRRPPAAAAPR